MRPIWLATLLLFLDLSTVHAGVGTRVEDFQLRDSRGQVHHLSDLRARQLVVLVFFGTGCPLAKLYGPRLAELAHTYDDRGVAFVGINANQEDALSEVARYGRLHHIPFPLLKDVGNVVADRFGAERSPEAFVLDERRVVRYRGRIDDQYDIGIRRSGPTRRDLAAALDELLAGKPVSVPVTPAPGCLIGRVASPPASPKRPVTYCRDVAPILEQHCQVCHRPGQVAPFALTTYREAAGWAPTIQEVLEQGRMPPWHANPRHGKFANDPSLSPREKQLVLDWIQDDCPEGDPQDLSPPPRFSEEWNIPGPDLVVSLPEPFTVPAEGVIEYQYFSVDPGFTEDQWVEAAEIRPGNRAVVHHCNVFLQPPGSGDLAETGALGSYCLAAMAPGTPPTTFPTGTAKRIPAGWRLVFVLHYTAVGSVQTDQTRIGLKFADPRTVKKAVATKLMYDPDLCIPPRAAGHRIEQTWQVHRDVEVLALFPHMHLRGKSFRYEVLYPDGTTEVLLDVPRYDFNWQHRYVLAEPKQIPAGTRLRCTAVYDNSPANRANPDPSATVRAGTQSWDEMFNGYWDVVLADEDLTLPQPWFLSLWSATRDLFRPRSTGVLVAAGCLFLCRKRLGRLGARNHGLHGSHGSERHGP